MTGSDRAGDAPLLRNLPLLFVDDLDHPVLGDADHHHFRRVLRIEPGTEIAVGDGDGAWRPARFGPEPEPTGEVRRTPASASPLTVAFTPVKGTKPEWVVQKLTELGIDRIALVETERSVVRWDDERRRRQHERLLGAAREACLQCRRLRIPGIDDQMPLARFLAAEPAAALADPDGVPPTTEDRTVVIGPEGGFTEAERTGRRSVRLPGHVLRAETAVVTAAATIGALRAELVRDVEC
ncbi:MAG: RsmE family RNA methyltransferase [Actinomycetota bacterium]